MNDKRNEPNTLYLEGMRCPKCGSQEPFFINGITANAVVYDEGASAVTGITWKEDADCMCQACRFEAMAWRFKKKLKTLPQRAYRVTVLAVPEDSEKTPIRLGSMSVDAMDEEEARRLGVDELWNGDLDDAGCSPAAVVQEVR